MSATVNELVHAKKVTLQNASNQLKSQFIGLNSVIDRVIEAVSSWYLFPKLQERPVIINLWGLTGVGKSSLVKRLSELIGYENKCYRFDLGEHSDRSWIIKRQLMDIYERDNGFPIMLTFDEFQHARTIGDEGKESEQAASRIVWEILDNGKFQTLQFSDGLADLHDLRLRLRGLLNRGVRVTQGRVVSGKAEYCTEFRQRTSESAEKKSANKNPAFVPSQYFDQIFWIARDLFDTPLDVKTKFATLDGYETLEFIKHIIEIGERPKTIDCSKSIVFVVGNLDEAYTMSSDYNPDMDPDVFYNESLKISISHVKRALKKRFRNEQIARLGNTHIIYPALSKSSFMIIIANELKRIASRFERETSIRLIFDESVVKLIYKEGVFPSQGVRPLFTTMNQVISSKLGTIAGHVFSLPEFPSEVAVKIIKSNMVIEPKLMSQCIIPLHLPMEELRVAKHDDLQSIVAVHESGHCIVMMALSGIIPSSIYSVTADADSNGFVSHKEDKKYIFRKEVVNIAAEWLGGIAAEELLFGAEYVTTGGESDIRKVTMLVSSLVKNCGLGKLLGEIRPEGPDTSYSIYDTEGEVNTEITSLIAEGFILAKKLLEQDRGLLIEMADYLSDHISMHQRTILQFVEYHGTAELKNRLAPDNRRVSYRHALKLHKEKTPGVAQRQVPVDHSNGMLIMNEEIARVRNLLQPYDEAEVADGGKRGGAPVHIT